MDSDTKSEEVSFSIWQDRDIRFDIQQKLLSPRLGEVIIDKMEYVEDTKGNNGVTGEMTISNLRLTWVSTPKPNVNLSIGLKCITQIKSRVASSKLKGQTESLYILTKCNKTQFEFIFTNLISDNPKLFATVMAVHRAYETSKLYREIKLRGAILDNKSLRLLPKEQLYDKVIGVMNLSIDQGTLGTMYITNVRVAWHANTNDAFNISIPFLHIVSIKMTDSKFGMALVIETHKSSGYILGFRIDPYDKLKSTLKEIHSLYRVFSNHPIFGVEYHLENLKSAYRRGDYDLEEGEESGRVAEDESDVIVGEKIGISAAYFADPQKTSDRKPVFNPELGLAIETLPEGFTLKTLWEVT